MKFRSLLKMPEKIRKKPIKNWAENAIFSIVILSVSCFLSGNGMKTIISVWEQTEKPYIIWDMIIQKSRGIFPSL